MPKLQLLVIPCQHDQRISVFIRNRSTPGRLAGLIRGRRYIRRHSDYERWLCISRNKNDSSWFVGSTPVAEAENSLRKGFFVDTRLPECTSHQILNTLAHKSNLETNLSVRVSYRSGRISKEIKAQSIHSWVGRSLIELQRQLQLLKHIHLLQRMAWKGHYLLRHQQDLLLPWKPKATNSNAAKKHRIHLKH